MEHKQTGTRRHPEIGCIILGRSVFFEEERFFKPEDYGKSFPRQVVRLKYFDEDFGDDSVEGVRPLVGSQNLSNW